MILLNKHSLTRAAVFDVETCGLTMEEKTSTLTFSVGPEAPEIGTGAWIMDDREPGAGIVYRVRTVDDNYQTGARNVTCEHIIASLKDSAIFGEKTPADMGGTGNTVGAEAAIRYALGLQAVKDWELGGFGYSGVSAGYSFNGDNIYEAIGTVCTTLEDPWWSYDVSSYPFKLYIRPKDKSMACEMRAGRNISTIKRTVDATRMYTRIYPIGKDDLHLESGYLSKNENIYGAIMKVETDTSIDSADMLQKWAQGRLNRHCEPTVTVSISGLDLSTETGEALDKLTLGRACRVPLPEFGTNILENIVKLAWRDKIREPENVTVTLGNNVEDVANIIRQEINSGSGTSGRAGRVGAKQQSEDHAWFVDTEDHVAMVAEAIYGGEGLDEEGNKKPLNWSRVSSIVVDGNGINETVTKAVNDIITNRTNITLNDQAINLKVDNYQKGLASRIDQNDTAISLSVGTIPVTSTSIGTYDEKGKFPATGQAGRLYFDKKTGTYYVWYKGEYVKASVTLDENKNIVSASYTKAGEIAIAINESGDAEATIKASHIVIGTEKLDDKVTGMSSKIDITDGKITQEVTDRQTADAGLRSAIDVQADRIGLVVEGTGKNASIKPAAIVAAINDGESTVKISADHITLDGEAVANSLVGGELNVVNITAQSIETTDDVDVGGNLSVNSGDITAEDIYSNEHLLNVADASVSGGTLTITKVDGTTVTFSKATALSGTWSGSKLTITGTPTQTPALKYEVGFSGAPNVLLDVAWDDTVDVVQTGSLKKKVTAKMLVREVHPGSGDDTTYDTRYSQNVSIDATPAYNNGWEDAAAVWDIPRTSVVGDDKKTILSAMTITEPRKSISGTVDPTYTYRISADDNYAYLKYGSDIIIQAEHDAYNHGFDAVAAPTISFTAIAANALGSNSGTASIAKKTDGKTTRSTAISITADFNKTYTLNGATNRCVELKYGSTVFARYDTQSIYNSGWIDGGKTAMISKANIKEGSGTAVMTLDANKTYEITPSYKTQSGTETTISANKIIIKTAVGVPVEVPVASGDYVEGWNAARAKVTRSGNTIYRPAEMKAGDAKAGKNEEAFIANYKKSTHEHNNTRKVTAASGKYNWNLGNGAYTALSFDTNNKITIPDNAYRINIDLTSHKVTGNDVDKYEESTFSWTDK